MFMQVVLAQVYKMDTLLPALHTEDSIAIYTTTVTVDIIVLVVTMESAALVYPGHQALQHV